MKWRVAPGAGGIQLLLYFEFDSVLSVDRFRQVCALPLGAIPTFVKNSLVFSAIWTTWRESVTAAAATGDNEQRADRSSGPEGPPAKPPVSWCFPLGRNSARAPPSLLFRRKYRAQNSKENKTVINTLFWRQLERFQKSGAHWVAFCVDATNNAEFFDSYGRAPDVQSFKRFLSGKSRWQHNEKPLQGPISSVCGQYCLYFLLYRVRGVPMRDIVAPFTRDLATNDEAVTQFVNRYFGVDLSTFDVEFLAEQVCRALLSE